MDHTHPYALKDGGIARRLPANRVSAGAPFHWLRLGARDLVAAPWISLLFGAVFSLIPAAILALTLAQGTHLVILPATVAFALVGPLFAVALYDVAWQLERGRRPSLYHSFRALLRNPAGEWGFAVILTLLMIAWMRLATLIHALYPTLGEPSFTELGGFLAVGSLVGALMLGLVFSVSAFAPQIMLERRVDMMTAIVTSVSAVRDNALPMLIWALLIGGLVVLGFATSAVGFVLLMPLLSYASWHAYIAVIETRRPRRYE
ncbi:DUF2189 domain-containing protein [Motiliproteus sp. SC1-56]|uniref:DUF2189 domain-containing protein n=1 Tax=Motiliproteus sp. SC1-56 TaxID=2799565 RepID=UPI001A8FAD83|nr:DUF2189 domain-containing protein [Motiliproteus sp. SC1-56]